MKKRYENYSFADFIADDEFFSLARKAAAGEITPRWEEINAECLSCKKEFEEAYLIINTLKIELPHVPDQDIEASLAGVRSCVARRRRSRRFVRISSGVAAAVILALLLIPRNVSYDADSIIASLAVAGVSDSIEMVIGSSEAIRLNNDASIILNSDGSIDIGRERKITGKDIKSQLIHLNVPYGKRSSIRFSDGTIAYINSGTKLVYPSVFEAGRREIFVAGEMYLDVARDEKRPFHVKTDRLDVRVLGTSFNISAYPDEDHAGVVLVSGSVEVTASGNEPARIVPGECLVYSEGEIAVSSVDVTYYTGWKDGYIKLAGEPLAEVFRKLSRYYNIKIECDDEIAEKRYRGKLDLSDSVEGALANIALTEPMVFHIREGVVFIMPE